MLSIECFLLWSIVLSLPFFYSSLARSTCYWPNGSNASDSYDACQSGDSPCCSKGHICLSNYLCYGNPSGLPYRGACTRQDWNTPACPRHCDDVFGDDKAPLYPCNNENYWWCGNASENAICQSNGRGRFTQWTPATFVTTVSTADSDAISTSFTVTSSVQSATQPAAQTSSIDAITPSSTPTVISDNHNGRSQTMVAIGVGVGVPLSIMALGGFSFLVWRERRRRPVHKMSNGDPPRTRTLNELSTSSDERYHDMDGDIALPELPVQREPCR